MRKLLFAFVILLACCAPKPASAVTATPAVTPTDPSLTSHSLPTADWSGYTASVQAFQIGPQCPHLCWLGINPGVTTAADAYQLLQGSDQIDQTTLQASDTGIQVTWYTEKTKKLNSAVYLYLEKDHVKSVSFDRFAPFKVKDFTGLLGDPYGINIDMEVTDSIMYMPYQFYYSSQTILLGSEAADTGPNANDGLVSLSLNIPYNDQLFRPWVGYGHLKEYFAGKQVHQHSANP